MPDEEFQSLDTTDPATIPPEELDDMLDEIQNPPEGETAPQRHGRHGGQTRFGSGINSRQHRCIYFGSAELIGRAEVAVRVHRSNLSRVMRQLLEMFIDAYEKNPDQPIVEVKGKVEL